MNHALGDDFSGLNSTSFRKIFQISGRFFMIDVLLVVLSHFWQGKDPIFVVSKESTTERIDFISE